MRRVAGLLLAAALATGALAGCGGSSWAAKCTTKDSITQCTPQQRTAVKDAKGELLDGTPFELASDRGKVVVVNFWGSWCKPCRIEAADLEKTYQATKDQGVTFLGIDTRDDRDSAKLFEQGRVTYPSVYDFDGSFGLQVDSTQSATPQTLVLDRQGRIAYAIRTETSYTQLLPLVQKVVAEGPGAS